MVILRPIITEKSMKLADQGFYTFEVTKVATKKQVAKAVANKFNVKVLSVRTINIKGEKKAQRRIRGYYQTADIKKSIVEVKKGQRIPLFETPKEEEVVVASGEKEPVIVKEKKGLLGPKVKIEKGGVSEKTSSKTAKPTTQRKVITGK